jgi:hypothetical protein
MKGKSKRDIAQVGAGIRKEGCCLTVARPEVAALPREHRGAADGLWVLACARMTVFSEPESANVALCVKY